MKPAQILVVDDEPDIATSLADYLSSHAGYTVWRAYDGQQAMEKLEAAASADEGPLDLVILDQRMPGLSGREVLTWLRAHPDLQYTRVIMLTGASGSREKVEALEAGADDYITKPYYPQEILARVNTILRTQQLEKQLQRQSAQLAALSQVSNALATLLDVNEIPEAAVAGVQRVLDVSAAAIFLQSTGGGLRCRAAAGFKPGDFPAVRAGQGAVGCALSEGVLQVMGGPSSSPLDPRRDLPAGLAIESILAVPLSARGRTVGVLWAAGEKPARFTAADVDLFASLARAISQAIENASLFQSVRVRQQELQESHSRLQAVINGILHPIYTIDERWRLLAVNRHKTDSLGVEPAALLGQICYRAFFDRDDPCSHCQVAQLFQDQQPQEWPVRWLGDDHLLKEWEVSAFPLPGRHQASPGAVVVWQDRTEQRRLENSLLQAGKLAAIGQLAAGVAHEINNPLTAISVNAQILKMVIPAEDDLSESVELIARAGERASHVVRSLLDFARQNQYSFEPGDVNLSLQQALQLVAYQLRSARIDVNQQLAPDLPLVEGSWEHMTSVWLNVLINARDALLPRSEPRRIEVVTRQTAENEVQVIIADNGVGLTPAEAAHIFEPFYTTKDPGHGTGLGLATSQQVVHQHGGEIEVISEPGNGATFIVRLPVHAVREPTV
jgi:two-component system, NtrC family, sensor kinase